MKIIAGCSSLDLTHAVCKILNIEPIVPAYKRFSDGEISVTATEPLSDETCVLIHSLSEPVNDNIITLLLTINALKQSGADKIVVCIPYLAYTRQEHTVSLVISLMHAVGAHHCITIAPHSHIENAVIPINVLSTTQLFANHIKASHKLDNLMIVSPDQGGIERCRQVHSALGLASELIVIDKIRTNGACMAQTIHGDVRGKRCLIIDDIIDTGTTLCSAAEALMKHGAAEVFAYCTHGLLSGEAITLVQQSSIKKLVITDTIAPRTETLNASKIEVVSVSNLLAECVRYLYR
jgi:ribose-phosphate pyrophosphokinase